MPAELRSQRDACALCCADGLAVRGYPGVGFTALGHPVLESQEWVEDPSIPDGCWVDTDSIDTAQLAVVMVGDDTPHVVDVDAVTVLPQDAFCRSCGQVGCTLDLLGTEAT